MTGNKLEQARERIIEDYIIKYVDKQTTPYYIAAELNKRIRSTNGYPFTEETVGQLLKLFGFQSYAAGFLPVPTDTCSTI